MVEGQAGLLGDQHNTGSRQENKKQEWMQAARVYSRISLCLLVHSHLLPIYRDWIVQLEWELACALIWSWEKKLPAILECGRVGIFSIMACPEALNHIWRYLVGLYEVQQWIKETLDWCTLGVRPYGMGFHKHARPTTEILWHLKKKSKMKKNFGRMAQSKGQETVYKGAMISRACDTVTPTPSAVLPPRI